MKKHFHAYAKGFKGAPELRDRLMEVKDCSEVKKLIEEFLLRLDNTSN
jgi:tRNA-dihydrouridine synthase